MKSIRVEKIDALIASLEKQLQECDGWTSTRNMVGMMIRTCKELEKESEEMISQLDAQYMLNQMTARILEEQFKTMIPLSAVEARIKELESYPPDTWDCYDDHTQMLIEELKELTKDKDTKEREK